MITTHTIFSLLIQRQTLSLQLRILTLSQAKTSSAYSEDFAVDEDLLNNSDSSSSSDSGPDIEEPSSPSSSLLPSPSMSTPDIPGTANAANEPGGPGYHSVGSASL